MLRPRVGFHVDESQHLLTVRYVGDICGDEILPKMLAACHALDKAWRFDVIHDLRRHTGRMDIRDNEAFAQGWRAICGGRDAGRCTAIVSNDPLVDARLPLTQAMFPGRTVAVFGTNESARAWIDTVRAETAAASVA